MAWVLTWIGQSTALAVLTAAVVRLPGCRASAAARSAAWGLALLLTACLACFPPFLSGPVAVAPRQGPALNAPTDSLITPIVIPAIPAGWLPAGAALWAVGSFWWLVLTGRDLWRLRRLRRTVDRLSPEEQQRLGRWLGLTCGGRSPRLCWCDAIDGPVVLGFANPLIALPRSQADGLTDEQLQHVTLHELAHVRRRDDWAVLVERLLAGLMWVHPAVHWMRHQAALAREMACDDWAVRQTAAPVAYARSLTAAAGLRKRSRRLRLAAAATGRPSALGRRVVRLLESSTRRRALLPMAAAAMAPIGVGIVALGLIQMPPLVVIGATAGFGVPSAAVGLAEPGRSGQEPDRLASPRAEPPSELRSELRARPDAPPTTPGTPGRLSSLPVPESDQRPAPGQAPTWGLEAAPRVQVLESAPLSGVAAVGVTAPDGRLTSSLAPGQVRPWWGGAVSFGATAGERAATAGRATASFMKRLGTRVPQALTR